MTIEHPRNFYNTQTFQPIVMHPADGRTIPVHHSEFVPAAPGGRTITVYQPDDTLDVVDLLR